MTIRLNASVALLLLIGSSLIGGCISPRTTRLPTFATADPRLDKEAFEREKKSLERYDPFPSKTDGPETYSRPRGFIEQRTEIRRTLENGRLRGLNRDRIPADRGIPSSELEYPNTVRE